MTAVSVACKASAFIRSLMILALLLIGLPWALTSIAQARFGGSSPLRGIPRPAEWSVAEMSDALTERLSDATIADIVIRLGLLVGWAALIVVVVTIVAETAHMIRHGGLPLPDVRGLGITQRAARLVATGLLVVIPMISRPAVGAGLPLTREASSSALTESPASVVRAGDGGTVAIPATGEVGRRPAAAAVGTYVVVAGDSVYGIAERQAGPDPRAVAAYADELLDLNLGLEMVDGRRFTNAAFIDVGWELQLPERGSSGTAVPASANLHVVAPGESLWSIAEERLDDPLRWHEIFDANQHRTFADGATFTDPSLIQPGWELALPSVPAAPTAERPRPDSELPDLPEPADLPKGLDQPPDPDASDAPIPSARPDNGWHVPSGPPVVERTSVPAPEPRGDDSQSAQTTDEPSVELLTFSRAAMLSAGVLALLAVRRRSRMRAAPPRAIVSPPTPAGAATERALRTVDAGERFARVDIAVRAVALDVIDHHQRVLAVIVAPDGELELIATGRVVLPPPWEGRGDRWSLAAATPLEMLAGEARKVGAPTPALVQLGQTPDGRDVYVDLEAIGALEVGGPGDKADAIVAALAATLAASVLAEVTTLIGVGLPDEAFLGHRLHISARDVRSALDLAAAAVGSTALQAATTFALRARVTGGETWDPAVVLVGAAAGAVPLGKVGPGLAVVSASPIHGPSSRLAPDGDAWALLPAGIRVLPVGLEPLALAAIADLVDVATVQPEPVSADLALVEDDTVVPFDDSGDVPDVVAPECDVAGSWALLVRLLGAVDVESASGERVDLERSKTRELIAWLATHRERATRGGARTALWELDVRDATFANVVSEARRALARLVEPPDGEEWVGRTMTDALPLHPMVRTDAELLAEALEAARLQPPALAISTLAPAVERITGMPFAGTSYLWPDAEGITSNLVLLATSAAAELAAHCLSIGDVRGVFDATGRGLRVLPGHEQLIGLRMRAHATAGDHAGVRQEWESYERVITADPWSDGEPSPKLVELRRELLNPPR